MTTNISMLAIDLAKGSFQVCALGPEGTCVDGGIHRISSADGLLWLSKLFPAIDRRGFCIVDAECGVT